MQNIRLIKRKELEKQPPSVAEKSVAPEAPAAKTPVEVVKTWVTERKHEQQANARQMFDALFAQ